MPRSWHSNSEEVPLPLNENLQATANHFDANIFPWPSSCTVITPKGPKRVGPCLRPPPNGVEANKYRWDLKSSAGAPAPRSPGRSPRAGTESRSSQTFHQLLGRLTSEFDSLWASNTQLRAENARLKARRTSIAGSARYEDPFDTTSSEAFLLSPGSPTSKLNTGRRRGSLDSEYGTVVGDCGDDELIVPKIKRGTTGRPVLHSEWGDINTDGDNGEKSAWRRVVEGEEEEARWAINALTGATQADADNVDSRPSNGNGVKPTATDTTEDAIGCVARRVSEWTEQDMANAKASLMKDDDINPKFRQQASAASVASELSLLPTWKKKVAKSHGLGRNNSLKSRGTVNSMPSRLLLTERSTNDWPDAENCICAGDELREDSVFQRFMSRPSSWQCFGWDIVSVLFMLYELIIIPLQVFDFENEPMRIFEWWVTMVWTLDIVVSFFRGADIGGVVELRPSQIAKRYLRSWFFIDVVLACLDWAMVASAEAFKDDIDVLKSLRFRRILRIIRIARLLRIAKLMGKESINDMLSSKRYMAVLHIGKLLIVITIINHYVACGWYGIGIINGLDTWVDQKFGEDLPDRYHYATSLHWSMTQFTPASMEVVPTNTLERYYAVCAIFSGLVVFSSFVSNVTHAVASFHAVTLEQSEQSQNLKRYLASNRVSIVLTDRVLEFLKSSRKTSAHKRLHEKDVAVLKFLPEQMLSRLHQEVYGNILTEHALMSKLRDVEDIAMNHICNLAMSEKTLLMGEELFRMGVKGVAMYFLVEGNLHYYAGYGDTIPDECAKGDWLAECALWAQWEHRGRLAAEAQTGELMILLVKEFHCIVAQTRSLLEVQRYARIFCTRAAKECGGANLISDLYGSRAIADTTTRRAFNHGDSSHVINKVVLLWNDAGKNQETPETLRVNCFTAWKQITATGKQGRPRSGRKTT